MFLIERPLSAVAAALAVALLIVALDRACEPSAAAVDPPVGTQAACAACAAHAAWGIVRAGS